MYANYRGTCCEPKCRRPRGRDLPPGSKLAWHPDNRRVICPHCAQHRYKIDWRPTKFHKGMREGREGMTGQSPPTPPPE